MNEEQTWPSEGPHKRGGKSAGGGNDIGWEIQDVFPGAGDLLYLFMGSKPRLALKDVYELLKAGGIADEHHVKIVDILLWFAFLGVVGQNDSETYAYSVYYDMKKLRKLAKEQKDPHVEFAIHHAFWPFLEIKKS